MNRMLREPLAAVGGVTLAVTMVVSAAPAQGADRPTFKTVRTLPHTHQGTRDQPGDGGRGNSRLNTAVSTACNDGDPLGIPQWYFVGEKVRGSLRIAAQVQYETSIDVLPWDTETAVVDHWSGKVLSCSAPFHQRDRKPVDLVAYTPRPLSGDGEGHTDEPWFRMYVSISRVAPGPPANDLLENAQPIEELPFSARIDTALADDDGPDLMNYDTCHLSLHTPAQRNTVWYRYEPSATGPAPSVSADPATNWMDANHLTFLHAGFLELLPDGSTELVQNEDEWDCYSPVTLTAGKTYLIGLTHVRGYDSELLAAGGPIDLAVTAR